jgi:hypothetical protein
MAAVAGVTAGPPLHWGNAAGRAVIAEIVRFPASTAGDTLAFVSKYLEEIIAVIGNVSFTAPVKSVDGAATTMTTHDTIAANNFNDVLVIGYARRVHSGGMA